MATDPDKAAKVVALKKQIEEIAGHEIDVSPEQLFQIAAPFALSTSEDGMVKWWRFFPEPQRFCVATGDLLDVSGSSVAGADGKSVFRLSGFACAQLDRTIVGFAEPINVVATPRATSPSFLTMTSALVNNASDVEITVLAWNPNGSAAPNVSFDWRCRVVSIQNIQ